MCIRCVRPAGGAVVHLQKREKINSKQRTIMQYLHSAGHIVPRACNDIGSVRTPLHLPHSIFVPHQLGLTYPSYRTSTFDWRNHPTVPHSHGLVDPAAREHHFSVFIPIKREHFCARRRHCDRRCRERRGETVGSGRERRLAQVEDFDGSVG